MRRECNSLATRPPTGTDLVALEIMHGRPHHVARLLPGVYGIPKDCPYGTFLDELKPQKIADPAKDNAYTLVQGLPNGKHVLAIAPNGDGDLPVRYLTVYQPMPEGAERAGTK